jgi:hypothetical protein
MPPGRPSWPALLAGNLLIFLAGLVVVFGAFEGYYRFLYDTPDSFGLTLASRRWFERHYRMNGFGVRDDVEYSLRRPPGGCLITFLGDSFTAGHGIRNVDDRFANRIRAIPGQRCEINVFAQNGFDTGAETVLMTRAVQNRYPVDVVVLVYCLNDIADIVPEWKGILDRIYRDDSGLGWLVKNSYFANALYYRLKARRDPDIADYYHFVLRAYGGPLWEAQQERLRSLRDLVQGAHGRFLVVTFPFLQSLGPGYEYREVHERLDRFWAGLAVPHLDLLPLYERQRSGPLTVSRFDAHPNERAHALAARAILDFLDEQMSHGAPRAP